MNAVELALARQRLQYEAGVQRETLAAQAAGLRPLFDAADALHAGAHWVRRHPEAVAGGVAALAVSSPRARHFLWRWTKRSFFAWRLWREGEHWLATPRPLR